VQGAIWKEAIYQREMEPTLAATVTGLIRSGLARVSLIRGSEPSKSFPYDGPGGRLNHDALRVIVLILICISSYYDIYALGTPIKPHQTCSIRLQNEICNQNDHNSETTSAWADPERSSFSANGNGRLFSSIASAGSSLILRLLSVVNNCLSFLHHQALI
jgi:hypothetical protein